jgi:hypothetical protein
VAAIHELGASSHILRVLAADLVAAHLDHRADDLRQTNTRRPQVGVEMIGRPLDAHDRVGRKLLDSAPFTLRDDMFSSMYRLACAGANRRTCRGSDDPVE